MAQRIGTGRDSIQKRVLRPVATQAASFETPPAQTPEGQIADALASVAPSLARFGGVLAERANAQAKTEGDARAREMAEQGRTVAEMARKGELPPERNEWFRVGFYETMGRAEGMKYVGDFLEATKKNGVDKSVDLEAYDQFEREYRAKWLETRFGEDIDAFTANAFGSTVDGQMAGLRNEFARTVGQNLYEENKNQFYAEIVGFGQAYRNGVYDRDAFLSNVRIAQERQAATGQVPYSDINLWTAQAVAAAALESRDITLLETLDEIGTDRKSNAVLGQTSYGMSLKFETEMQIATIVDAEARKEEAVQKARATSAVRGITAGVVEAVVSNPDADLTPFVTELAKIDPASVNDLYRIRDSIVGGQYQDSPHVVQELAVGIHAVRPGGLGYTTQRDLNEAFGNQQITLNTFRSLSKDIEERDANGGTSKLLQNPVVADVRSETRRIFVSEFAGLGDQSLVKANGQMAADEAAYQMITWLQANPSASAQEINKARSDIINAVVRSRLRLKADIETRASSRDDAEKIGLLRGRFLISNRVEAAALDAEINDVRAKRRNSLSERFLTLARLNGIDPTNPEALRNLQGWQTEWNKYAPQF